MRDREDCDILAGAGGLDWQLPPFDCTQGRARSLGITLNFTASVAGDGARGSDHLQCDWQLPRQGAGAYNSKMNLIGRHPIADDSTHCSRDQARRFDQRCGYGVLRGGQGPAGFARCCLFCRCRESNGI